MSEKNKDKIIEKNNEKVEKSNEKITETSQDRHNRINWFLKEVHQTCLLCGNDIRKKLGVGHHVHQKDKVKRPAELAKGPTWKLVQEWRKMVIICHSCHSRITKAITPAEKNLFERTLRMFNEPHNGIPYIANIPQAIFDVVVMLHGPRIYRDIRQHPNGYYNWLMLTLVTLAKRYFVDGSLQAAAAG